MDGFGGDVDLIGLDSGDAIVLNFAVRGGHLTLPGGDAFIGADFVRDGYDLTLTAPDGQSIIIPDYFLSETPPDLLIGGDSIVSGALATKLAGPMAPGQYAQAATTGVTALGESIGSVTELTGSVTVTRADGTQVTLGAGDSIYQGDALETGTESSVGLVFADDTTFSLDADGRMVLDEMIYDPDAQTGIFQTTVVKGVFSFVSGQVAKTGADAMVINTLKTTIGIRGSTGLVKSGQDGDGDTITLVADIDGNLGELIVSNQAGSQVLNLPNATTTVISAFQPPAPVVFMSPQQIQQNYGGALTVLVRTEAKKAVAKAEAAAQQADEAEQQAVQQQEEAAQAEEEAAQAEENAAQAEAEAEAAQAEAEAAKAEAEAATDPEAKAAAEAKVADAEAKVAAAEAKAATESEAAAAKSAEAAAKAEAADQMAQHAAEAAAAQQHAQEFSQMAGKAADIQQQVFTQFVESGLVDPGLGGPGDVPANGMIYISANGDAITVSGEGEVIIVNPDGTTTTASVVEMANTIAEDFIGSIDDETVLDYLNSSTGTVVSDTGDVTDLFADANTVITDFQDVVTAVNGGGTLVGGAISTNFYFPWATLKGGVGGSYTVTDTLPTSTTVNQISFDGMDDLKFTVTATSSTSGSMTLFKDFFTSSVSFGSVSYSGISQFLLSDVSVVSFSTTDFQTSASGNVLLLSGLSAGKTAVGYAGRDGVADTITISGSDDAVAFGKSGNDIFDLSSTGSGHLLGGDGADTFTINTYANGWSLNGGSDGSMDHFNYANLASPSLYVYMAGTTTYVLDAAQSGSPTITHALTLDSTDKFTGSAAADFIHINSGTFATIEGGVGNDTVTVAAGTTVTTLDGGAGNDTFYVYGTVTNLTGTSGTNSYTINSGATVGTLVGGSGNDTVNIAMSVMSGTSGAVTTQIQGGAGTDVLFISANNGETVTLETYASKINADIETVKLSGVSSASAVTFTGMATRSTYLDGSASADTLRGGTAADILHGQDGDDTLVGAGGVDQLTGGLGADAFRFESTTEGPDTITDFSGQSTFALTTGEGDKFAFLNSAFSLGAVSYAEVAWDGTTTPINSGAANVVVLTGGSANSGTLANALGALAAGTGTATNAIIVFNDSGNGNAGTVAYTTDLTAGSGPQTLAVFSDITADMAALSAADFSVV